MNVAFSSVGTLVDDKMHDLFGRCDYFLIVDSETGRARAVKNEFAGSQTGAGTACVQVLFDEGVRAVVSVKVGPNAYEALNQSGVEIFLAPSGITVLEALSKYKKKELPKMEITKY